MDSFAERHRDRARAGAALAGFDEPIRVRVATITAFARRDS